MKVDFVQTIHRVDLVLPDPEEKVTVDSAKRTRLADYGGPGLSIVKQDCRSSTAQVRVPLGGPKWTVDRTVFEMWLVAL